MKKSKKLLCLLFVTLMLITFSVTAFAGNETNDGNIKIEVVTNKNSYKSTGVAEITATITNVSGENIDNVTAQAVFNDLSPAGKRTSETRKSVDVLKSGESFSFTYKATLNKNEHSLNIFEKIILFFVRLFNGGYTANNNSIDVVAENVTEIEFGKYTAENVVHVGYGTIDTEVDNKENNKLSDDNLLQINEVDVSIDNLMESDEYKSLTDDKLKAQAIIKLLTDLEKDGLIQKDSIHYYEELNQVGYHYICGVSGGVYLYSFNNLIGGISISSKSDSEESTYSVSRTNLNVSDNIPNIILTYGWDDSTSTGSLYQKWDNCVKEMSERGSIATIYDSPSVFDYKTIFSDVDFICIGEHGAFDAETNTYCFAVNGENASVQADIAYNTDLYFERVLKRETNDGTMYFITPEFFSYYYNSKLNDTIVFISSCSGFGANGAIDYKFAKAFHDDCGANSVIGFHNDVWLNYALDIIDEFSSSLLNGYTVTEALNIATLKHGDNHNIWIKANEDLNNYASDIGMTVGQYIETNPAAIPIMYGEPNAKLDIQTSTITGIVTDSETNAPIPNVTIEAIDNESSSLDPIATATTDINGKYEIKLPYGNYSISFTHDDYEYYGTTLSVSQESCVKNAVLSPVGERAQISGTVTDGATSEPIPYVTIQFINSESVPVYTTITNENGAFEAKIPYGTYTVAYSHSDYEPSQDIVVIDREEVVINKVFGNRTVIDSGECGADGDNVTWTLYEDGELVISGSGDMENYEYELYSSTAPWYSKKVTSVIIEEGITSIGNYSFYCNSYGYGLTNIVNISIPSTVKIIGVSAFHNSKLSQITISEGVATIGNNAFDNCDNITSIIIPDSITTIGDNAFADCDKLTTVTFGKNTSYIGDYAFWKCDLLEELKNTENIGFVGTDPFYDTKWYENQPLGIIYIGTVCYRNKWNSSYKTTEVVLKEGTTSIAERAFYDDYDIETIILNDGLKSIGDYAFSGNDIVEIYIPSSVEYIGYCAFTENPIKSILVDENNQYYSSDNVGALFDKCKTIILQYPNASENVSYNIPSSVNRIEGYAFSYSFHLSEITMSDSISYIGYGAFENCSRLSEIILSNNVSHIDNYTFSHCSSLRQITLSKSIKEIDEYAFYDCTSLTDVYYTGTQEEWEAISIDPDNTYLTNATIHYNS